MRFHSNCIFVEPCGKTRTSQPTQGARTIDPADRTGWFSLGTGKVRKPKGGPSGRWCLRFSVRASVPPPPAYWRDYVECHGPHHRRSGRILRPRNCSTPGRFSTVLSPPLASSSIKVEGTSSHSNPRRPKASRYSQTMILLPSVFQPLGTSPSFLARADVLNRLSSRALTLSYLFSA